MTSIKTIGVSFSIHMASPQHFSTVSPFLMRILDELRLEDGLALDIPSGMGRHSVALEARGMQVVAADLDMIALKSSLYTKSNTLRVQLDANRSLPFKDGTFDLAVIVHPLSLALLKSVPRLVRTGGYIIFETFSAHGGNWVALPHPGEIATLVTNAVAQIDYREKRVRNHPDAVTVKALFMKT